jgi:hypothetical protein
MIEALGAAFGVRTIFVWQPAPSYKYDVSHHLFWVADNLGANSQNGYALMDDLHAQGKIGPDFLWLADMQQDRHENLYVDRWHYTAAFSKEIAARICNSLRENVFVDCPYQKVHSR